MRYPQFIHKSQVIDLVAPSFGANIEPYHSQVKHAIEWFKRKGYCIHEGSNIYLGNGIGISNTPQLCAKELMDAYLSENQGIISVGGGEMMCTILPFLDFNAIAKANEKWFMGFSDNTNFSFVLTTGYDIASINGTNMGSFGLTPMHQCVQDAYHLLTGNHFINNAITLESYDKWEKDSLKDKDNPLVGYQLNREVKYVKSPLNFNGTIKGRLLVGTLDCLLNLCGTQFDYVKQFNERYANDGIIWVLDACELTPFMIARGLWQLKNAGWFNYVNGFIFGRSLTAFGMHTLSMDAYNCITSILNDFNVPIIMDFDYGHYEPCMPFIVGSYATFTIQGNHSQVTMELK